MLYPEFYATGRRPTTIGRAWWFAFVDNRLAVRRQAGRAELFEGVEPERCGIVPVRQQYLGRLRDAGGAVDCFAAELDPEAPLPDGYQLVPLRRLWLMVDDERLFWIAARAYQLMDWDRSHQFCSRCGHATEPGAHEHVKTCPACDQSHYPRIAPAVIVAVERDGHILLAHNRRHPEGLYSVIAGFVEPGETLEECVAREVNEETGIDVTDIRYFGSQPWPFPHSLMIGFTARYAGGEFCFEDDDIETADWFPPHDLPTIPASLSISRRLIDDFVARYAQ